MKTARPLHEERDHDPGTGCTGRSVRPRSLLTYSLFSAIRNDSRTSRARGERVETDDAPALSNDELNSIVPSRKRFRQPRLQKLTELDGAP